MALQGYDKPKFKSEKRPTPKNEAGRYEEYEIELFKSVLFTVPLTYIVQKFAECCIILNANVI